jgi:hypothetical protein
MSEQLYWVKVKFPEETVLWDALTKDQANFVYSQQVEVVGINNCSTGQMDMMPAS